MRALVTGAGGFLGGAIARRLREQGADVRSVSRREYPHLAELGVEHHALDLSEGGPRLRRVVAGCDVVFHCAARPGVWGPAESYLAPNVDGTQEVLSAAARGAVRAFVHTSSPSVCFDGHSHRGARELPRARRFLAPYPESKARAEALVLRGLGPDLAGCILRPHLLFGAEDPHLIPRLIERARAGRLVRITSKEGTPEVSLCHVDTAASAHVAAAEQLLKRGSLAPVHGRAYFLAQRDPVGLWEWIERVLTGLDLPLPRRTVDARRAYVLGAVLEHTWRLMGREEEPPLTRFVALQLATSHSYDMSPLEQDLGWREDLDLDTATERTIAAWRPRIGR